MVRPLLLVHGYSSDAVDMEALYWQLAGRGVETRLVNVGNYLSLNNEVTIEDIAEGLEQAISQAGRLSANDEFDAVVHSTGMLVVRAWLARQKIVAGENTRLKRLKHLIGLAPATWGSPQAHKGRTWLGALVKGSKTPGPDFLNAGDQVLDGLELGSKFTWDLAHADLLGAQPYFGTGPETPYVAVFIGNTPYTGLAAVANDPGTDGTVRWAGCDLNTRKITLDLTQTPTTSDGEARQRVTMSEWASATRLEVPMLAVEGRNHGTLISDPDQGMMDRVKSFLDVDSAEGFQTWVTEAKAWSEPARQKMLKSKGHLFQLWDTADLDGWQQFVVHARDAHGDPVTDYMFQVFEQDPDTEEWVPAAEISVDAHAYGADQSYRCLHVQLPKGITTAPKPMRIGIRASTGTDVMAYQGYDSDAKSAQEMHAGSDNPVMVDVADALMDKNATLFYPFTTTLVEIVLNRLPYPFGGPSKIFAWWPPFAAKPETGISE